MEINLASYGRVGDAATDDDTEIFEQAISHIATHGGGRLLVAAGNYRIRPINLTSHFVLYLSAGAKISGVANADAWPVIPPLPSYGQGRDHVGPRYTSLLHGEHLVNVTIQGQGMDSIIDGRGVYWWVRHRFGWEKYTRGHLVEFMYSSDVRMYNLQLQNSPFWTNHFYDCDNVHVRNVHIRQPETSPNTDGWDPDSSRNVLIEDSSYHGGDDCVAIKSGWDCFGIAYATPCVNITIRNVTCHGKYAGLAIGSEMSGGIENVTVEHVHFSKVNKPGNIKTGNMRGGYVRNVLFRDILVDGPIEQAIHIDTFHYNDSPNPSCPKDWKPDALPEISNIRFINVNGTVATITGHETYHLFAYAQSPIRNVYMENVSFPVPNNGVAWNCSGLQGSVKQGSVSPWPPCDELVIVDSRHVKNLVVTSASWRLFQALVVVAAVFRYARSRRRI